MQTLRNEGASEFKIKEALQRKELAANERYNNRSTVGYLIQMNVPHKENKSSSLKPQLYEQTQLINRMRMDKDKYVRAVLQREVSEYNRQHMIKNRNKNNFSRSQQSTVTNVSKTETGTSA